MRKRVIVENRKATDVDRIVGETLRRYRCLRGLSQEQLGEKVGRKVKQIRKYERGENRISAGMLHRLASALEISIGELFRELPEPEYTYFKAFDAEVRDFVGTYDRIKSPKTRKAFLYMVKEYANSPLNM